ncbi:MAG: LysR family transcriptional regulator [Proteobacteria bacterium]|nr:LysR family transcriptional regulator [Pseudomonadota bacterium]
MELRHLRYAIAVADERSVLRAATRLHMSQPPLSTQIRQLEEEIGTPLFLRGSRGVVPTPAGQAFVDEARAILARIEQLGPAAQRAARGESGMLSIGFVSITDFGLLPAALKRFREAWPGIAVHLHELTTDAQIDALADERIDVGLALAPVSEAGLRFVPIARERLVLAVPADHAATLGRRRVTLARLAGEPFVMVPRRYAPGLHASVLALCDAGGFVPQVAQEARQMQTVIALVAGGLGIALVPESMTKLQRPDVRYLRLQEGRVGIEIGCLHRVDAAPPVARFIEAVSAVTAAKR